MEPEDFDPTHTDPKPPPFEFLGVVAPIKRREGMGPLALLWATARSWAFNAFMEDVKIAELNVGLNSVSVGDRLTFNDDQTPTAAGQIGMNTTTGRMRIYVGGASRNVLGEHEVVVPGGSVPFSADQSMGGFKLTNLPAPTSATSNDAARATWVTDRITAAVDGMEFADGVDVATTSAIAAGATLSGATLTAGSNGAFSTIDDIAPEVGYHYLLKDDATTKRGVWTLTTVGDGGNPWVLTRRSDFAVGDTPGGKILPVRMGTTNGGYDFRCTNAITDVVGTATLSFTIRVVTSDHGAMTGLSDDDHTIYPLLLGRSGGQSLFGGTGSGDDLVLASTSDATKGDIQIASGTNLKLNGNDNIIPATSGQGKVGTSSAKFAEVNTLVINTGHLHMRNENGEFTLQERPDGIEVHNHITQSTGQMLVVKPWVARLVRAIGLAA